ncbi:hypothetical protein V8B97DRAFT_2021040 [Scleroderma yunnanense]
MAELHKHINTGKYGIGLTKFMSIWKHLQVHTHESIQDIMIEMHRMSPNTGACEMIRLLFHEHNMAVLRTVMQEYFVTYEPHLMRQQKTNCLQHFNDIWVIDQHDKWLHFGFTLHIGIEPFSGCILWMKLILSYYIKVAEAFGHKYTPMVTQSNPSTENIGIVNVQTLLWQMHNQMLEGFKNIMPEIAWSQLRQQFTPGFKVLFETGVDEGWYNPDNTLQLMVFHWVFIPWLQVELNSYQDCINNSQKHYNKKKVLPHGILELIYICPQDYSALSFKVMVSPVAIHQHWVFDLVPPSFNAYIEMCYHQLGCPPVGHLSAWTGIAAVLTAMDDHDVADDEELQLLPGLQDLHEMDGYMGGLANGLGLSPKLLVT